jgi:hypothetical protein
MACLKFSIDHPSSDLLPPMTGVLQDGSEDLDALHIILLSLK